MKPNIYDYVERGQVIPNYLPRNSPSLGNGNPVAMIPAHFTFITTAGLSVRVLEDEPKLKYLQIQNASDTGIYFAFNNPASTLSGIFLAPGQVEIYDVAVPIGSLNIFCTAGGKQVNLQIGT